MNKHRRKELDEIITELENLKGRIESASDEEREYYDNMPENLQDSEKGQAADMAADALMTAIDTCDEVISSIEEAKE